MSDEAKRTSKEQIGCYLSFLESHPEIKLHKNNPTHPRRTEELWEDLAGQLNALKGPTRSAAKWRECLSHWKNQVRSRARKTKAFKMAIGPCSQDELGARKQRALEAFGTTVVDGISDVPTLGVETEFVGFDLSDVSSHTSPTSTPSSSSSTKRRATSAETVMELVESLKERNEEERQYRSDSLKCLENVAVSFGKVAESINNIATALLSLSQSVANNINK